MRLTVEAAGMAVDTLLLRRTSARALLVFGHGAGAGIAHPATEAMVWALAEQGIATLRFQFPFMQKQIDVRGGNRGFGRDPLPVALATIAAALDMAENLRGELPLLLGGHSYGARMASHAATEVLPGAVRGLLLLSFPLHTARQRRVDKAAHFAQIELPVLCLSGERDAMASAPLLEQAVAALPRGSLQRVPGADHGWQTLRRFDGEPPLEAMASAARAWFDAL